MNVGTYAGGGGGYILWLLLVLIQFFWGGVRGKEVGVGAYSRLGAY